MFNKMRSRSPLFHIKYYSSKIIKPNNNQKHIDFKLKTTESSTSESLNYPCMTREYIRDMLYGGEDSYFQKKDHQVGMLTEPIHFKKLLGYYAYRKELKDKYPQNAWVTPSEIFKPFFGYMIGNYIIDKSFTNRYKKIKIIEIGPGTGALSASILEFFRNNDFDKKIQIEYNLVEISSSLCDTIESRFKSTLNEHLESGKVKIYNSSIFDFKQKEEGPSFVIGMEILDNMPHDRIYK